ncbi:MAG: carbohydrate-binding domain-containing protein [Clostridia bacterium]|nr:carbohydrate-binding domain-containing protein [Clostridia bacterium]
MKLKNKRILPALLALAVMLSMLMLTACGSVAGSAAGTVRGVQTAMEASTGNTASAVSLAASSDTSAVADDAFSERDVSGEYDEDGAVVINLDEAGGSDVVISEAGTYILSGTLSNGGVTVSATNEDKIQLVLNGVKISSDTYAAIYVEQADKVFITLAEGAENELSNGGSFVQKDDNNVDGVIFSKDDLTINGSGSLTIVSPAGHGIVCKDELVIAGGTIGISAGAHAIQAKDSIAVSDGSITVNAAKDGLHAENDEDDSLGTIYITGGSFSINAGDDGIHAVSLLRIDGGKFSITAAEGLEATYVLINDGEITVSASDDGINAAHKSSAYSPTVEINGGSLNISMGRGDTDGIDANGSLIITGGTIDITGSSAFDFDGSVTWTGGTVTVNGQEQTQITGSMMGGMGGFGGRQGFGGRGR